MKRRHDPLPGLVLWPFLALGLIAFGARPLAKSLTGVEPPSLVIAAPARQRAPAPPIRKSKPLKGWDI